MANKNNFARIILLVSIFLGFSMSGAAQEQTKPGPELSIEKTKNNQIIFVPFREDDPSIGPPYAKVTVVQFSDFQCPSCRRAVPIVKELSKHYGDDLKIVWKNQPLPIHKNAFAAALAAEAAGQQGKFWEMHELLFQNQKQLSATKFEDLATQLQLDLNRFKAAMRDQRTKTRVQQDAALAWRVGASGTPTFFINGRKVVGAQPIEVFKNIIHNELATAARVLDTGAKLDARFYPLVVETNQNSLK